MLTQTKPGSGLVRKGQRLAYWFARRNPRYIALRLLALLGRYGITPTKAENRVRACVDLLARFGCQPTFPTPGRVVKNNAAFCRELQAHGVELAIHGFDHVDFSGLEPHEATRQFERAAQAFLPARIQFAGFRCPYLSYTDRLLDALPPGMFAYSSNRAVVWDVVPPQAQAQATTVFEELSDFYHAEPAERRVVTPRRVRDLVEIPASLPDDIQIYDGLKLGAEGIQRVWLEIFRHSYARGELFTILFHPELYENCALAFETVLEEARQKRPGVWVARLRDIADWWKEKSQFSATVGGGAIHLVHSGRGTVLVRNLPSAVPAHDWDGTYRVLETDKLPWQSTGLPFVGLGDGVPETTRAFLVEQGYLVETGAGARQCELYLTQPAVAALDEVQLIECIEASTAPLVRWWRWPSERKSALSVTGDLDTVSLMDYMTRLIAI